jgi:hypothetical protein
MLKSILTILLFLVCHGFSAAQADLPKIIQPSPSTAALFRYQDYPVDHSTGLPQISVPIYEVKSGSLSVPISISYHASGRKTSETDGPIALGWSLNAGGTISRTIYGSPDFGSLSNGTKLFPYPFKRSADLGTNLLDDLHYFERITHFDKTEGDILPGNFLDSEYDIFSYSVNGLSGKFIFEDNNSIKTPVFLPSKPYKITPTYNISGISKIDLTDDKGILYQFVAGDTYSQSNDNATSAWVLSKIFSADKSDSISFYYSITPEYRRTIDQQTVVNDQWAREEFNVPPPAPVIDYEFTINEYYFVSRLTEIRFSQGKIVFNLINNDKIDNVQILNLNNEVLKTIQFTRSICDSHSELGFANYKLDNVIFKDKLNAAIENYSFEYFPTVTGNGQINSRHRDWWGYYNASGIQDMVPTYTITDFQHHENSPIETIQTGASGENREPDLSAKKSGVLKKITFPTGGNTEFIYENNKYTPMTTGGIGRIGPGLRIYQIKTSDINGTIHTKTYKYGENESDYGTLTIVPGKATMGRQEYTVDLGNYPFGPGPFYPTTSGRSRVHTFYAGFLPELNELAQKPVFYSAVTEYSGDETNNTGKTIYLYEQGAEWFMGNLQAYGNFSLYPMHTYETNYWNTSSLTGRIDYKRVSNSGVYQKIKETTNSYSATITRYVYGLHVRSVYKLAQTGRDNNTLYYPEEYATAVAITYPLGPPIRIYGYSDYQIPVGYKNLMSTTETLYTDNNASINNGITYQYNSRQYVSKSTSTSSEGSSIVTDIKYPFDFTSNSVLTQMVGLNMLDYPVEQIGTKNLTPTQSIRTNYFNWGTTPARIAPQTVDVKLGSGIYETRLRYSAYDSDGNPLTVSKENDLPISYVWGYNNSYPIAEGTNAAVKNVFHTSFEDATGNSTLNDCKTGRRSRTGGYSKPLTLLDNGNYILSYWQKSGANWVLQSSSVSVTTGSYTISLTGQVDEVRFYPKTSQMKTYTYDPLIGITTECDASDHISYYEYDNYGRLKLIRDMNGNILRTFKYQYQVSTPN